MANDRGTSRFSRASEVAATYRIFDTCIRSHLPLPELPVSRCQSPQIIVRRVKSGQLDLGGFFTCHDWRPGEGPPVCRSARRGDDYLLIFPDRGCFHIAPDAVISCLPGTGVGDEQIRQLLLSQVLPRYLAHTGELLLHASAATLPSGKTLAFLGESGHGKSTLAACCHRAGAEIIDDDCIRVHFEGRHLHVTGGAPTIRLYPDSRRALAPGATGLLSNTDCSGKEQLSLPPASTPGPPARILDGLFLLAAPEKVSKGDAVRIEPATGQEAIMAILGSAFTLDPSDSGTMLRTLSQAGRALKHGAGLQVQRLYYPRKYDSLDEVLQALMTHFRV